MAVPSTSITWQGVVLSTTEQEVADNPYAVPASQIDYIFRTIELMNSTPDGNVLVGYRCLYHYNTPVTNSIGQLTYATGHAVLVLVSPFGRVLDRKVAEVISGFTTFANAWV